jgi:uncharacterized membrane protein
MSTPEAALPFVAPCRRLPVTAAMNWLALAWRDMRVATVPSVLYGAVLTLLSAVIAFLTWRMGMLALYLGLASGFVFLGPFLAMGLYALSDQLERGKKPSLAASVHASRARVRELLVLGLAMLVVLLVWARAATLMNVFRSSAVAGNWRELIPYLGIGSAVGAVFCAIVFAATAFALPMLLDRKTDAVTAVVTSINATLRNKGAMLFWGIVILVAVLVGFATFLIGFVVLLPLIGHATWHAYRATIDASAWPAAQP